MAEPRRRSAPPDPSTRPASTGPIGAMLEETLLSNRRPRFRPLDFVLPSPAGESGWRLRRELPIGLAGLSGAATSAITLGVAAEFAIDLGLSRS